MDDPNATNVVLTPDATRTVDVPRLWLRAEGAAALVAAVAAYQRGGHSWALFALLFLTPDLSMFGYLAGPRVGSVAYNLFHTYVGPAALAAVMLAGGHSLGLPLIWAAHIGFDRLFGYGLKYADEFANTHLGRIGKPPPARARVQA